MQVAEDAGVTGEVATFATNVLVIVTPPDNPAGIESLDDLADATWVRCADEVPCGRVALGGARGRRRHRRAGQPRGGRPGHARQGGLRRGRRRAWSTRTDAVAAGDDVDAVEIPGAEEQLTTYFIATLEQAEDADLAQEWVDLVTSEEGQQALTDAGFTLP